MKATVDYFAAQCRRIALPVVWRHPAAAKFTEPTTGAGTGSSVETVEEDDTEVPFAAAPRRHGRPGVRCR